jgi:hypothetical protein
MQGVRLEHANSKLFCKIDFPLEFDTITPLAQGNMASGACFLAGSEGAQSPGSVQDNRRRKKPFGEKTMDRDHV